MAMNEMMEVGVEGWMRRRWRLRGSSRDSGELDFSDSGRGGGMGMGMMMVSVLVHSLEESSIGEIGGVGRVWRVAGVMVITGGRGEMGLFVVGVIGAGGLGKLMVFRWQRIPRVVVW